MSRVGYKCNKSESRRCRVIREIHENEIKKKQIENKLELQLKRFKSTLR